MRFFFGSHHNRVQGGSISCENKKKLHLFKGCFCLKMGSTSSSFALLGGSQGQARFPLNTNPRLKMRHCVFFPFILIHPLHFDANGSFCPMDPGAFLSIARAGFSNYRVAENTKCIGIGRIEAPSLSALSQLIPPIAGFARRQTEMPIWRGKLGGALSSRLPPSPPTRCFLIPFTWLSNSVPAC